MAGVSGSGSAPNRSSLAIFLSRLRVGRPPVVYEDGRQTRDFVSVHDLADAVLAALTAPSLTSAIINVGSGVPRRIGDVARDLARVGGVSAIEPTVTGQFRRGDVRHCVADITRARHVLGFAPRVRWEDGLAELVEAARVAPGADRFRQAEAELRGHALLSDRLGTPASGGS
jgi:dTDP-L-rhamnose 4-epimerase